MKIDELKRKFIVDEDLLKAHLEPLVEKALLHCKIDQTGRVLITNSELSGREQVMITLVARALAHQLDTQISEEVSTQEICNITTLPENQVRARVNDLIKTKLAQSPKPGVYKAAAYKIEAFLDEISVGRKEGN